MSEEEYRDDVEMEEYDEQEGGLGQWLQDNLRIIISVIIVLLLALGIYSYSKRSQDVAVTVPSQEKEIYLNGNVRNDSSDKNGLVAKIGDAVKNTAKKTTDTAERAAGAITIDNVDKKVSLSNTKKVLTAADVESTDAFVVTAHAGNGRTHLARRALAMSLEKNSVEGLTGAHKVYIEDYLQKAVNNSENISIGQEIRFSKDLINKAIESSQKLTSNQLKNLEKYTR